MPNRAVVAVVCLSAAVASGFSRTQPTARRTQAITLRFHHLHYRVVDPGGALGEAAALVKGTRIILQGVGVGVRVGREYLLFDREPNDRLQQSTARAAAEAYLEAARWLGAHGVLVQPESLRQTAVGAAFMSGVLDHVAFAADDLAAARAAIRDKPIASTDDALRFRLRSGLVIEIVRDTDRPDTYWCPMHPDVRKPTAGTCPRCGMALVPIPPPRIGEYRVDVDVEPRAGGGATGLRVTVREPDTNDPVSTFIDVHERQLHLFIVSRDLARFAHVHPERAADGTFTLRHELDPGEYVIVADFLPATGTPQLVHRAIVTPGYDGPLFGAPPDLTPGPSAQIVGGVRIRLDAPSPRPRRFTSLRFEVADAETGAAVQDLEPYLGASGHLLIVSQDATAAVHAHPDGALTSGPLVTFDAMFPAPGRYKLWVQFQRKGTVLTAPFVIEVPSS